MKKSVGNYILEIVMIFIAILFTVPLWMVLVNSVKSITEVAEFGIWLPKQFHFENYVRVFAEAKAVRGLLNGIILSFSTVIISVVFASMASFYISRSRKKIAGILYVIFVLGIIVPSAVIPTYLVLNFMGMINTYHGLILVNAAGVIPFSVFLYCGYISTVPRGLDEAAVIDGCSGFHMFFKIIFPLLKPVTVTIGIFNFLGVWNDVTNQLYFASPDKWTMPMTVYSFYGTLYNEWNVIFADIVVTLVPLFIIYILGQKYIISGMTAGAIKA
ncbi:carbohydrate ABC transporter membrane protein 2 (CUT1 family) [Anaerobacterium chartisolvens]|uniref:Carbohydrate ABC transporter membrane protein 2 (CUT1 family) n=1 Tax=Anaerobacterium chartisolvens TaxID=1297424 RepID=A0A369BGQ3_9FIRM|nr:carbohydrate ABC transporter permease [Anaerobacterium chartisolvens]RCX18864.1 carbohydrate ABC transporter membrane protein 2 (CUT1 family) [Anaerobacterium chartisolvens]